MPGMKEKTTQAVKTTPHIDWGKESHFGTEYRKIPLPTDKQALSERQDQQY